MLTVLGVALAVTLVATPLLRPVARRLGLVAVPGTRSSHDSPTPRVGGVAILLGVAVALAAGGGGVASRSDLVALLGGGALLAVVGLLDDRFDLPPLPRLGIQILAAGLVVRATGGFERVPLPEPLSFPLAPALGATMAVLWIVAVTNFYNFMDGIDGLATLQGVLTATALALALSSHASGAATLAAALAGAMLGFLAYNWAPASVFLGDVGSGVVGFTLASLPLMALRGSKGEAALLVAASLFLFLADTTICLLGRSMRGERVLQAHRQHLYQRWGATGATHATVSLWLGFGALVTTSLALIGWRTGDATWYWASLGLGGVFFALERRVVERREARVDERYQ